MGIIKKALAKKAERKDKKIDARLKRKGDRVDSKNRARENKVQLKFAKDQVTQAAENIEDVASDTGMSEQEVSNEIIQHPKTQQQLRGYLNRNGITPMERPLEIAAQTNYSIAQRAQAMQDEALQEQQNSGNMEPEEVTYASYPLEDFEEEIYEEEFLGRNSQNFEGGEPDNFLSPAAIAAIAKGGGILVEKVNEKRVKEGKKPLPKLSDIAKSDPNNPGAVEAANQAAQDEYIRIRKQEEIKKMLPQIIGGLALLTMLIIAITYYSTKD